MRQPAILAILTLALIASVAMSCQDDPGGSAVQVVDGLDAISDTTHGDGDGDDMGDAPDSGDSEDSRDIGSDAEAPCSLGSQCLGGVCDVDTCHPLPGVCF